ncbi:MAG: Glu-tRNA(Gln) amidotransferase subunit GatE [Candidatus Diapherotrites archaeon]
MDLDFKQLGLKCGLEVHQQLESGKLFCRCPSILREDKPHLLVKRQLRAVASELGEYDAAALEAAAKGITFVYEAYKDTNCLIELDEEPVKPADKDALKTVLEISLMLGADVMDEIFVMRKAVIDGSNTSGFQRTALVATGGKIRLESGKELGVQTIALEEDAARPTKKTDNEIFYRLDRLGIPLIELATAPGISSPKEAKEAARAIGTIFRLTGRVKRGLGTIRQDLNVSIRGGARVEIKGVQELDLIDLYVQREVERQLKLVEVKWALEKRQASKEKIAKMDFIEVSKILDKSDCKITKGKASYAMKLAGFKGIIGKELQPGKRLGSEFAAHVKAKAGLKGIFHSDELPNYGITQTEVFSVEEALRKKSGFDANDAFVIVVAEQQKAVHVFNAVIERAQQCLKGVPEETRNALADGNTEYSRPLPGAARMYPETDLAPIKLSAGMLEEIKKHLPSSEKERIKLYIEKFGLSEKLAKEMATSNFARFFEHLVGKGFEAVPTAVLLLEGLTQLKREKANVDALSDEMLEAALLALKEKKITREVLLAVLKHWGSAPQKFLEEILGELKIEGADEGEVQKIIAEIAAKNASMVKAKGSGALSALMGDAMKQLRGKASGDAISKALKQEIGKLLKE